MKKFLFIGAPLPPKAYAWVALCLRLFVGILMLTHAFPKIANYPTLSLTFPIRWASEASSRCCSPCWPKGSARCW